MDIITNFKFLILLIGLFINSILAFIVYKNNHKSATSILFGILSIVTSLWMVNNYLAFQPTLSSYFLLMSRLSPFFGVWQVVLFYLLSTTLPYNSLKISRRKLLIISISAIFVMFITLSPFTFMSVEKSDGRLDPIPGFGLGIFGIFALFFSGMAVYTLFVRIKRSYGKERQQLSFVLFGIFLMLSLIFFTILLPAGLFKNTSFVQFSPLYALIFLGLTTYSIIKHRLMDIRAVVARTVSFTLLTVLFAFVYALAFSLPTLLLASKTTKGQIVTISTLLAVTMAFSFQPLRRILEMISDKIFYKGGYDSSKLLARLGSIMSTNIELQPLTSQIIQTLISQMRISKGAFVILGEGVASIYTIVDIGFPHRLILSYNQLTAFLPFPQTIVFDELEENHLKSLMREMDISVVKTLKVENRVVGLLILGAKASGEIYSDQDLKVLDILAPEAAVAIQNAQSYDKIKKFNVILAQEVRRATADLQQANQRLKVVDQLKDDFVSIASHELRTPMTAIRSYAWMALHKSDVPLSEKLEKYIVRVLLSTERLINLVNDMLNLSRIESGKIEINPEPIDLLSLVRDIVDELYFSKSQEKQIHFVVLEKTVPKVFADPEKLRQVFMNLVGNALKFTPPGGKITFDFFTDGKVVETSVSDTGVGISGEDMGRLFHKFGRLDNSYTAAATSGGTGLGLYISKNLIELMHGKIRVWSEGVGRGATFTVSLPVATQDKIEHAAEYAIRPKEGEAKPLEPVTMI